MREQVRNETNHFREVEYNCVEIAPLYKGVSAIQFFLIFIEFLLK